MGVEKVIHFILAYFFREKDSGRRILHLDDYEAVVRVAAIQESVYSQFGKERVLVIVGGVFAIVCIDDIDGGVRLVGTKIDFVMLASRISVQIGHRLAGDVFSSVYAKAAGLKSPVASLSCDASNDIGVLESDVKMGCLAVVVVIGFEIGACFRRIVLNGTIRIGAQRPNLGVAAGTDIAPDDAVSNPVWRRRR